MYNDVWGCAEILPCEVSFNPRLPVRFRNRVAESFLTFKNIAAMYTKAIPLQTVSLNKLTAGEHCMGISCLFVSQLSLGMRG